MLAELMVRDFALIKDLRIEFVPGFNALTGETGAGKSLVVDALGLILGERGAASWIRDGAQSAMVAARFVEVSEHVVETLAGTVEPDCIRDEGLTVRRVIMPNGRSRTSINDVPVTARLLRQIAPELVDLVGQFTQRTIIESGAQTVMLDTFGRLQADAVAFADAYAALKNLFERRRGFDERIRAVRREEEFLRFQYDEISHAELVEGEDGELAKRRKILSRRKETAAILNAADEALSAGDASALSALARVTREIRELSDGDETFAPLIVALENAASAVEDASFELGRMLGDSDENAATELERIETRLDLIYRLKSKYGESVNAIIAYAAGIRTQLEEAENSERDRRALDGEIAARLGELNTLGLKLREGRVKAARRLGCLLEKELDDLGMSEARVRVDVAARVERLDGAESFGRIGGAGLDDVKIMIAPNRGEKMLPLAEIASGGEIARVMLAIKAALKGEAKRTLVFDEVDSEIGARIGAVIGKKFKTVSETEQLIVVTHLAPLAKYADRQFKIAKQSVGQRTEASVRALNERERIRELKEMQGELV